jgi:hypothetical protein
LTIVEEWKYLVMAVIRKKREGGRFDSLSWETSSIFTWFEIIAHIFRNERIKNIK